MIALTLALGVVAIMGCVALGFGLRRLWVWQNQFDELMPQRMIDYSGHVGNGSPNG